jgi:hypothetical protein
VRVLGPKTAQDANKPVTFTQRFNPNDSLGQRGINDQEPQPQALSSLMRYRTVCGHARGGCAVGRSSRGHEREPNAALCGRLALPAEGDCLPESPGLGWAFTPGVDCDATRSLAADL